MSRLAADRRPSVSRTVFGVLPDGRSVELVTLRGEAGFAVSVMTWGATVQALWVPDRGGDCTDVVLGHDRLEPYLAHRDFFGATIGRYANRIADSAFRLDGVRHQLHAEGGGPLLHGGAAGFDQVLWTVETVTSAPHPSVTLRHDSPDGAGGFPGTLAVRAHFGVTGPQELTIAFEATSDRPTIVSLTHHGYFNLGGAVAGGDVLDHELKLFAERYLPVDADLLPLGAPADVAGTPFDFRSPRRIGAAIRRDDEQLRRARGYDHCFVLGEEVAAAPRRSARVVHRASGRVLDLFTDQPGLQFYSGNFLDGGSAGKGGRLHRQSDAFCLEPQAWPDSPNRPTYPSARLDPGTVYRHSSRFSFQTC